jgi:hypothetical protein
MTVSYATLTTSNMELTPMRVNYKFPGDSTFTDLGGTLDNVVITMGYKKSPIKADQLGTTEIDRRVSGIDIKVTTSLTEIQNKDTTWKAAFPHATLTSGSGSYAGSKAVDFKSAIGDDSAVNNAGQLLLHPLSKADADKNTDYLFYKACSNAESEVSYGPEGQAKLKIVWQIYPDLSVTPARFFRYGDKDLA